MGLRGVMESILSDQQDWSLHRMLDQHRIKKLVIISLNAVRTPPVTWDRGWAAPGIFDVLYVTASAPIRNNAFDTITVLQDVLHDDQARRQAATGSPSAQIDFISLDFPQIKDPALRRRVEATATALSLPRRQVDDLRTAAAQLLRDSPEMQRLLRELNP
jgi:NTE family protein